MSTITYVELPKEKIKFVSKEAEIIYDLSLENDYLTQENRCLKEKLKATNKGLRKVLSKRLKWKRRYYKEKYIRKELKNWLEETLNELKKNYISNRTSYEMGVVITAECTIAKIEELEKGKSE